MTYDEATAAISAAQATMRHADRIVHQTANLMRNRLRAAEIDGYTLAEFKRELRDFNAVTKEWKS